MLSLSAITREDPDRLSMADSGVLHVVYWMFVYLFLSLLFGLRGEYSYQSLLFAFLLMPVTMGAAYVILYKLIPGYFGRDNLQFFFWLAFTLVTSFYLILILITALFIVVAEYNIHALNPAIHDFFYAMGGAFVVVMPAIVAHTMRTAQKYKQELEDLREEISTQDADSGAEWLHVRIDGRSKRIKVSEIRYLESYGDHVHLHLEDETKITREPLYNVLDRLPDTFVRTHRSYAINTSYCRAFTREEAEVGSTSIPISRTYRGETMARLQE